MYLTVKETAKKHKVAKGRIKDMIQNNEIEYILENGVYMVNIDSVTITEKQKTINSNLVNNLLKEITNNTNDILNVKLHHTLMESNECHTNVGKVIDMHGGERVYVWIFTDKHKTYDLQFHSIWKSPKGELIEVTKNNHFPYKQTIYILDKVNSVVVEKFNGYYDIQSPPNIYIDCGVIYSEDTPFNNSVYKEFKYVSQKAMYVNNLEYLSINSKQSA